MHKLQSSDRRPNPPPLKGLKPFRTTDLRVAIDRITKMFGPHDIEPAGKGSDIEFEHSYVWLADICINQLAYGRELRNNIEVSEEKYCVMLPIDGDYAIETAGKRVQAGSESITVINPKCSVTLEASSDYRNVALRITRRALENAMANQLGMRPVEPVRFIPHPQSLKEGAEPIRNLVMQVWQECQLHSSRSTFVAVGRELEELLASMLLLQIPNNYSNKLGVVDELQSPPVYKVADFLRQHAREDISLDEVIEVSGVSRTTLYMEFGKFYEMTPIEYLRKERLRLAYNTLASGNSDLVSVTNVALDCGFVHFSRFANYYKQQFGELPSQTLQRKRRKIQ